MLERLRPPWPCGKVTLRWTRYQPTEIRREWVSSWTEQFIWFVTRRCGAANATFSNWYLAEDYQSVDATSWFNGDNRSCDICSPEEKITRNKARQSTPNKRNDNSSFSTAQHNAEDIDSRSSADELDRDLIARRNWRVDFCNIYTEASFDCVCAAHQTTTFKNLSERSRCNKPERSWSICSAQISAWSRKCISKSRPLFK